jgi:hypothetical protein
VLPLEEKCPSTTTDTFGRCWRPPSTTILVGFVVDCKTVFSRFRGPLMLQIRANCGRWSSGVDVDFGLWPTFAGCGAVMLVSLADLFFCSRDLAHVARCNSIWSGPWVPDVSLSVPLSVPHNCWLLAFIFWNRSLW